jgi:hypothetical protein
MPGAVKGGLFVGAAVAVGILAGLLVPSLVVAERDAAEGQSASTESAPVMPIVIGRPLDEAEDELRQRGIPYVTDAPDLVEIVVPTALEVCETKPHPGKRVQGTARLRAALAGTCDI